MYTVSWQPPGVNIVSCNTEVLVVKL